ncbi:DUF2442 domain-containing protein [Agrobacterium leguminum]|uniref:DUF2442 domain-containing protein n=1 Tax=Agrobacterium leguminum TaxID=2792015 RepID=A0A9X3QT93_9HYPH|nr:DUF2442 domain-containing protein [Agrobacterium leguminum]MCZ7910687.1 DUF2442 domain-containing protein [Agrobacterium leguminum]MCZ7934695.1 DUF2442 domain-containing protein [Agrobacterium leguminum]
MRWVEEIKAAFEALGGAARYADLYEYLLRTTARELTIEWKATVRRTIEDHSSDSLNHRADDLFQKMGHGHWGLRGAAVSEEELQRREKLSPQEIVKEVFVREHWRSVPGDKMDTTNLPSDDCLNPNAAWCTNTHLEIELSSGVKLSSPLAWYPRLLSATARQRANFELTPLGIYWPDIGEDISVRGMLIGIRGIPSEVAAR